MRIQLPPTPLPGADPYYSLLSHLASCLPDDATMLECGTYHGWGASALATHGHVVTTCDICDQREAPPRPTISFLLHDALDLPADLLRTQSLILLDIDPHDGAPETFFCALLDKIGFAGLLACDDIHLTAGMRSFWAALPHPKLDLTHLSHSSGFGLVNFNPSLIEITHG